MKKTIMVISLVAVIGSLNAVSRPPFTVGEESDEYASIRIEKFPVALQNWTCRRFSFFETLDVARELGVRYLQPYPGQVLKKGEKVRFDHNLSENLIDEVKTALREKGISLVSYGVVGFENTRESMKKVFDFAREMGIRTIVTEPQFEDLSLLEKMVRRYNIQVAIHNHPHPTKYARPETVLALIKDLDPRIGACADTGHWMRTGVNPVEALRLLGGRIVDVHLKDLDSFGNRKAVDVPFGDGKADIRRILAELTRQNYHGFLAVEHERKEDALNPIPPIRKGLDYIQSITYYRDYDEILSRSFRNYHKHGWNHYGPGYFELDPLTGILKGHGGMGLFWFSQKKYKDFILELDYKCAEKFTNSGIFLRIPDVPFNNDYIYHSFEIQINPAGRGIHKTAAVYDAEAPREDNFYPPGEWNHMKISFIGNKIQVELNGKLVLDWAAEPRGKVRGFSDSGYIGLQNHDSRAPVYFKKIFVRDLTGK